MGEIVELPRRSPTGAWAQGQAVCQACGHEWQATVPVGTVDLECPSCRTMRGVYKFPIDPKGGERWVCNCGNDLFYLLHTEWQCHKCGSLQRF